jgi:indolepyruvate ferredoxin oxidoreductase
VTSDLRIADVGPVSSSPLGNGEADIYLCFDLIGAAMPGNLRVLAEDRTRALISTSEHPTPDQIVDVGRDSFDLAAAAQALAARTLESGTHLLDAQQVVSDVMGDHTATNIFMLGMASQLGFLPVSTAAIEWAITQNGVAVERNIAAFRWGRSAAHRPDSVPGPAAEGWHRDQPAVDALLDWCAEDQELHAMLRLRAVELVGYQSLDYAAQFLDQVRVLWQAEQAAGLGAVLTPTVARQLFKLMAYKDEYEVARLHFDPVERERIRRTYGADAVVRYQLHPPILRAMGMKNKVELGPWFGPVLKAMHHGRRLRGTRWDPFGYAHVRKVERELIAEYRAVIRLVIDRLGTADTETLRALCAAPDEIRGYEEVKLAGVERFRRIVAELTAELAGAGPAERKG